MYSATSIRLGYGFSIALTVQSRAAKNSGRCARRVDRATAVPSARVGKRAAAAVRMPGKLSVMKYHWSPMLGVRFSTCIQWRSQHM